MGLFDYIKKKPDPVDTSRLPRLGNYGESPGSSLNFQFSRVQNQNSGQKYPSGVDFKPENQVEQRNPLEEINNAANEINRQKSVADRVKDGEDVFKALLDQKYQSGEESIKRQRAAEFWGNLANLFGQTVSSAAGARMFQPIKSNVPAYNQALDRLRDGYNDTLLNYSLANAKADREARIQQETIRLKADKDKLLAKFKASLQAGLIDKQTEADLNKIAARAKNDEELKKIEYKYKMLLNAANNEAARKLEEYRQGEITKRNGTSGTKGKKTKLPILTFKTKDGRKSKSYDPNDDLELLQYYRDGVDLGIFKDLTKDADEFEVDGKSLQIGGKGFNPRNLDPNVLRNYILYNLDRYNKVTNADQSKKMFGDGTDWSSYELKENKSSDNWEQYRVK